MKIRYRKGWTFFLAASLAACAHGPALQGVSLPEQPLVTPSAAVQKETSPQFESLLKSAEQGNLDAQFILAQAYEVGNGIEKNLDLAFFWYGQAANAGHVPAQFFLGAMYASSRGTPLNLPKAVHWYRQAAAQGYPDALYPMAYVYEHGLGGVEQDNEQALAWYRQAADTGNAFAFLRLAQAYRRGELGLPIDAEQARIFEEKQKATSSGRLISVPVGKQ